MRALFLDIDGILNTESMWKKMYTLSDACIKHLSVLCNKYQVDKIILSSSWRTGFETDNKTEQIKQLEKKLSAVGLSVWDKTPSLPGRRREAEIERFLYYHPEITDYAILDDDRSEFSVKEVAGLNLVDYKTGIISLKSISFVKREDL